MFGNEHRGLSDEAIKGADEKIYIPMKGMVQSLNISVTAGIVMYELDRQRRKNPPLTPPLTGRGTFLLTMLFVFLFFIWFVGEIATHEGSNIFNIFLSHGPTIKTHTKSKTGPNFGINTSGL